MCGVHKITCGHAQLNGALALGTPAMLTSRPACWLHCKQHCQHHPPIRVVVQDSTLWIFRYQHAKCLPSPCSPKSMILIDSPTDHDACTAPAASSGCTPLASPRAELSQVLASYSFCTVQHLAHFHHTCSLIWVYSSCTSLELKFAPAPRVCCW